MSGAFVLDCSAAVPWVFGDEATEATDRQLEALGEGATAWVPSLWHLELGNVLLGAQRHGRIDPAGVEAFLAQLGMLDIQVDAETVARAWSKTLDLAAQYGLSTYDAAYLELALRRGVALATLDAALIAAARSAGIPLCLE